MFQCKNELFINETKLVDENKTFYFVDLGSEVHGKNTFRLWVHHKFVTESENQKLLMLPVRNARVDNGKSKYTKILRPDNKKNVFYFYIECGYRGESYFKILNDTNAKVDKFYIYHSPRGNLGVSEGGLITTEKSELRIKWSRIGRLYGDPSSGIVVINLNGECHSFDDIECIDEIEDLAQ